MKKYLLILFILIDGGVAFSSTTSDLNLLINESFHLQKNNASIESVSLVTEKILSLFKYFDRSKESSQDLIEIKFAVENWRRQAAFYSLSKASAAANECDFISAIQSLEHLNFLFTLKQRQSLFNSRFIKSDNSLNALKKFMIEQTDAKSLMDLGFDTTDKELGPRKTLPMIPIEPSQYSYQRWSDDPEFANYKFDGDTLVYRSLRLKAGDFVMINQNGPADGLYTSLNQPLSYFSHFGLLIFMVKNDRIFPAIFEIHKTGIRAVPLSMFLSPVFSNYAEVFRLKNTPVTFASDLNREAIKILNETHAYDFSGNNNDRRFLNCADVGSLFLERVGINPITAKSTDLPGSLNNLRILGNEPATFLTPTDYIHDPRVMFVGVADNNRFRRILSNKLVSDEFANIFSTETINPARFPKMYKVNLWGAKQIEKHNTIGNIFLAANGLTADTFPNASNELLSITDGLESIITRATLDVAKVIHPYQETQAFSVRDFENSPEVKSEIQKSLQPLSEWFK